MDKFCDLGKGLCEAPVSGVDASTKPRAKDLEVIYVGDPMCSWCWGVSPVVDALQDFCSANGIGFSVVAGGLRPGGGEVWNDELKAFLRRHWEEIGEKTGQPFRYELLARGQFNYDTEPACRAVVAARSLLTTQNDNDKTLKLFFNAIQRRFYVEGDDPSQPEFYRSICEQCAVPFNRFVEIFEDARTKLQTREEIQLNRQWGVRQFPTFAVRKSNQVQIIASGFIHLAELVRKVEQVAGGDR